MNFLTTARTAAFAAALFAAGAACAQPLAEIKVSYQPALN